MLQNITTMSKIKNSPLRINVGFIIHETLGYSRVFEFDLSEIQLPDELTVYNLQGAAQVTRTSEGLLVEASMAGELPDECVRCLDEFNQRLQTSFTELYAFDRSRKKETEDLVIPEDGYIDLKPLVREYLLLETPINSLCKPDCSGLCPICGVNRNHEDCDHTPPDNTPPSP